MLKIMLKEDKTVRYFQHLSNNDFVALCSNFHNFIACKIAHQHYSKPSML
jgi:hypothetical protein